MNNQEEFFKLAVIEKYIGYIISGIVILFLIGFAIYVLIYIIKEYKTRNSRIKRKDRR